MYCGEQFGKGYCIAKIHWYRCVRRGVLRSYKEEREVSCLSMNAVIRTDGAVMMKKPPSEKRNGELDLSSEEQTGSSMLLDYLAFIVKLGIYCSLICKERHRK